jgi:DNA replication protein DnaC
MPVSCGCEVKQEENARKTAEQEQKKRKIADVFNQSQLPPKLARANFKNFEQLPGTQLALRAAVKFVKEEYWLKGEGLLCYGIPGNGKSHLAAAIYNAAISRQVLALFLIVPDVLTRIKSTYSGRDKYGEAEILRWVTEADLVVLDDLGAERLTETNQELIYKIINSLNNREKSLVVTTNLDMENDLPEKVGPRIYDRLWEMCRIVENKGWSYRRRIAERRLREQEVNV